MEPLPGCLGGGDSIFGVHTHKKLILDGLGPEKIGLGQVEIGVEHPFAVGVCYCGLHWPSGWPGVVQHDPTH